jgi:anti-sigma B factor antagonist
MAFHFTVERPKTSSSHAVIRMSGRLTLGPHLLDFGRRIAELLSSHTGPGVLLDVAGINDVDSAGLGELVILYTTAGQHDCRLGLVGASARLVQLLETTRLSGILPHFADEEAAKSWISAIS